MALDRRIRWRPLDQGGLEHFVIREWSDHIKMRGALVGMARDLPHGYLYEITLDPDWSFRSLIVQRTDGVMLVLSRDEGRWRDAHGARPDLRGCVDIDLSGSPSTNTLPIRRLALEPGVPRTLDMAYVDLARMEVAPDRQIYTRLGPDRYRYQSADGSFTAELSVDADGFVVSYPPLFERA